MNVSGCDANHELGDVTSSLLLGRVLPYLIQGLLFGGVPPYILHVADFGSDHYGKCK